MGTGWSWSSPSPGVTFTKGHELEASLMMESGSPTPG
jgi:hypothetical protein